MSDVGAMVGPAVPVQPPYSGADYQAEMLGHLPEGPIWPRDPSSVLARLFGALAVTAERVDDAAVALLQESPAGNLVALLPEWEATLGLPDPCNGPEPTIALRQRSVRAQIAAQGGQSIAYFIGVAAALGYAITVTEFEASRFGRPFGPVSATMGRRFGGTDWAYTWQVNVAALTVEVFTFGAGRFGDPFRSWGSRVLECVLGRIKPAHTTLVFAYSGSGIAAGLDGFRLDVDALA